MIKPPATNAPQLTPITLDPPPADRIISSSTQKHYGNITNQLRRAVLSSKADGHVHDASPLEIVNHLFENRARFRPKTFLMYRSALVWWLATLTPDESIAKAWSMLHSDLPKDGFKDEKGVTGATTLYSTRSQRSRSVSRKKLKKLLSELTRRIDGGRTSVERRRASELRFWVLAGLATGLRPTEWQQAFWKDRSAGELYVFTAKRKVGNYSLPHIAHLSEENYLPRRTVFIDSDDDKFWVDLHMKSIQEYLGENEHNSFTKYYNNNRMYLQSINRSIFKGEKGITLYMLRGQFTANRKAAGQPREELAQEMGCSAYYTSAAYGKRAYAHRSSEPLVPAPVQTEKDTATESADAHDSNSTTPVSAPRRWATPPRAAKTVIKKTHNR